MSEQRHTAALRDHLPAIYLVAAAEAVDAEPISLLLDAFQGRVNSIDAALDDAASYLDPFTAPAMSSMEIEESRKPREPAMLRTLLVTSEQILARTAQGRQMLRQLVDLIEQGRTLLAQHADEWLTDQQQLQAAWNLIMEWARRHAPEVASAASLIRVGDLSEREAIETMRAILTRVEEEPSLRPRRSPRVNKLPEPEPALKILNGLTTRLNRRLDDARRLIADFSFFLPPPEVTPEPDPLTVLGAWVGVDVAEVEMALGEDVEAKRRQLVKEAAVLWRHRGTPKGLKALVEMSYGSVVEIEEWLAPQGFCIGESSTIGVDTILLGKTDPANSFVVGWDEFPALVRPDEMCGPPDPNAKPKDPGPLRFEYRVPLYGVPGPRRYARGMSFGSSKDQSDDAAWGELVRKAQKLRTTIDRERPAHVSSYLSLGPIETDEVPEPMQIEHSEIGNCLLS